MTTEELRAKLNAEGVSDHYVNLICDPCVDAEDDGDDVLECAYNVANDEGNYLQRIAKKIESWEEQR